MSQKLRHTRKSTDELESGDFKAPSSENVTEKAVENGVTEDKDNKKQKDQKKQTESKKQVEQKDQKEEKKQSEPKEQKKQSSKPTDAKEQSDVNIKEKEVQNGQQEKMVTRSHSSTPQKKKKQDENVSGEETEEEGKSEENGRRDEGESADQSTVSTLSESGTNTTTEKIEMDSLMLTPDEPEPELDFEDSSDLSEPGKTSPVINRCKTRRSQSRNISTPKTPKSQEEDETIEKASLVSPPSEHTDSEPDTPKKKRGRPKKQIVETDEDSMASDNLSTQVEVGGDSTRLDYTNQDSGIADENIFLAANKDRTLAETLKSLSPRRSIRNINIDYRREVLRGNQEKFKLNYSYGNHNSFERVSVGLKRKNRSESPVEPKKMKYDSPGIFTRITSPLLNIKNRFQGYQLPTSTPKLTAYKKSNFESDESKNIVINGDGENGNRKWCSIM